MKYSELINRISGNESLPTDVVVEDIVVTEEEAAQAELTPKFQSDIIELVTKEQDTEDTINDSLQIIEGIESLFKSDEYDQTKVIDLYKRLETNAEKLGNPLPVKLDGMENFTSASVYVQARTGTESFMETLKRYGSRFIEFLKMIYKYIRGYFSSQSLKLKTIKASVNKVRQNMGKIGSVKEAFELSFPESFKPQLINFSEITDAQRKMAGIDLQDFDVRALVDEALKGVNADLNGWVTKIESVIAFFNLWDNPTVKVSGSRAELNLSINNVRFYQGSESPIDWMLNTFKQFKVESVLIDKTEETDQLMEPVEAYKYVDKALKVITDLINYDETVITKTLKQCDYERDYLISVAKSADTDGVYAKEVESLIKGVLDFKYRNAITVREFAFGLMAPHLEIIKSIMDQAK